MAIGSGLLWGKGLNNTDPTSVKNGNFILEPQNDFIFAVAGEELGFVGSAVIIILLLFITIECIFIARKAKDTAGRLICCGVGALIGFQTFCQYRCGERTSAKYRCNTSVCQLRTYIIMVFVYRYRACLKCRASAEKILTTGGPTT